MDDSRDDQVSTEERDGVRDTGEDENESVDGDSGADVDGTSQMADSGENRLDRRLNRQASPILKLGAIWMDGAFLVPRCCLEQA
jgi:hypothetical protein